MERVARKLLTAVTRPAGWAEARRRLRWCRLIWLSDYPRQQPVVCNLPDYGDFVVHPNDPSSLSIYTLGGYERLETRVMRRILGRGDVAIDGGANIGYYTILMSRLVGPNGRVLAFEPGPATYMKLCAGIGTLALENVTARAAAITRTNGAANIYLSLLGREAQQSLAVWDGLGDATVPFQVPGVTLDSICEELNLNGKIALLKLDLEGGEAAALEGGQSLFATSDQPIVMIEVNTKALRAHGRAVADLAVHFNGYECWGTELDNTVAQLRRWDWSAASSERIFNVFAFPRTGEYAKRMTNLKASGLLAST